MFSFNVKNLVETQKGFILCVIFYIKENRNVYRDNY